MFKNHNRYGSVLLMVVGLLVILGTLGGTFLLISSLDARQATLLAGRGRAELIASGAVSQVVRKLGEDLHFHPDEAAAPYTAQNNAGADAHGYYRDFPTATQDMHIHVGDHFSNILGKGLGKDKMVSTDSENGTANGYLVPTGEYTDSGEQFYVAINVQDMSDRLCLNTGGYDYAAGAANASARAKTPALIDLKNQLGGKYSAIHTERGGSATKAIWDYDSQCGRILLSPVGQQDYRPFAIADEVYLRWLGTERNRKADFGRVFGALGGSADAAMKQMLTTYNCSRSITRNPPTMVVSSRFDLSQADALDSDDGDDSDGKKELYTAIVLIAGSDDGLGGGLDQGQPLFMRNDAFPGFYGSAYWRRTAMLNSYTPGGNKRCQYPNAKAAWVFTGLPQATYRVWTTWGSHATLAAAAAVPYRVYTGGGIVSFKYAPGNLQRTLQVNQTVPPSTVKNGVRWQSLGSYAASGTLAIEIYGPQGVPEGESQCAFADAIMIEPVSLNLGSGSQPAAHLTANTWAAMKKNTAENKTKSFPFRPKGKNFTVFGVRDQPFITEAFATHTTRTITKVDEDTPETIDENSWRWGVAIELMNFSDEAIDLSTYRLALGGALAKDTVLYPFPAGSVIPKATATSGGRLVVYNFEFGDGTVDAAEVFGPTFAAATWKRVADINFDEQTIRLVQVAQEMGGTESYKVPIDHITAGDGEDMLGDVMLTSAVKTDAPPPAQVGKSVNKTTASNCRRDDDVTRERYAVAKYWKPEKPIAIPPPVQNAGAKMPCAITAAHQKLGVNNAITTTLLPKTRVEEGFRIKLPYGLLSGPGEMSDLHLVGPIIYHDGESNDPSPGTLPADLPELLAKEYAVAKSRGRANSRVVNSKPFDNSVLWNKYPRTRGGQLIAWPTLLGEIVETVQTDILRGDSPGRVYGRLNINTASKDALAKLPWPAGVNANTAAGQIVAYRNARNGFVTPGEVALAFSDDLAGANSKMDRDGVYAAISSCITVSSDVYSVSIKVQIGSNPSEQDRAWYYTAIIDRGGAVFSTDKPAVLLFTQLK